MYLNIVLGMLLALFVGAAIEYESHTSTDNYHADAAEFSKNLMLLGQYASHYAAKNQSSVGVISADQLALPAGYAPNPLLRAYVNQGSAYVYMQSGQAISPAQGYAYLSTPGIKSGLKSGGLLMSGINTPVALSRGISGDIPDGSLVYVARDVVQPTTNPPNIPGSGTVPDLHPAGAPLPPPITWNNGASFATVYSVSTPSASQMPLPPGYSRYPQPPVVPAAPVPPVTPPTSNNNANNGDTNLSPARPTADWTKVVAACSVGGNFTSSNPYSMYSSSDKLSVHCDQEGVLYQLNRGQTYQGSWAYDVTFPSSDYVATWSGGCTPVAAGQNNPNESACITPTRNLRGNGTRFDEIDESATVTVTFTPSNQKNTYTISSSFAFCGTGRLGSAQCL